MEKESLDKCECEEPTKVITRLSHICNECKKPVNGLQLKRKLKYLAVVGAIGYGTGQATEAIVFESRYPLKVEFSIVDGDTLLMEKRFGLKRI